MKISILFACFNLVCFPIVFKRSIYCVIVFCFCLSKSFHESNGDILKKTHKFLVVSFPKPIILVKLYTIFFSSGILKPSILSILIKFFKIIDCFIKMLQHNKFKLKKNLTIKKKNEGRSNGRITFNQRGNSTKKHIRQEDTITNIPKSLVIGIEYSPSQTSFLAKVFFKEKNQIKFSYTKCSTRTNLLNTIYPLKKTKAIKNIKKEGNFYKAEDLKVGDIISNVRRNPLENIRFIKSAGTFGQILETNTKKKNYVKILLPSKKQYFISKKSPVLFGRASNVFHSHLKKWKAGASRWIGKRPHVRGTAKNPIDHPHGGRGRTTTGGPAVTKLNKKTKGVKTRNKRKNSFFLALTKTI